MRARKNPLPFTLENLLREMKPGRGYSPEAVALMFGVSAEVARGRLLGAVMLGEIRESAARRGIRAAFWVPSSEPTSVADRRIRPLERTRCILVGYNAALWRLHDLCMSSRGQPELMRYPPISPAVRKQVQALEQAGEFERNRAECTGRQQPESAAQGQIEAGAESGAVRRTFAPAGRAFSGVANLRKVRKFALDVCGLTH